MRLLVRKKRNASVNQDEKWTKLLSFVWIVCFFQINSRCFHQESPFKTLNDDDDHEDDDNDGNGKDDANNNDHKNEKLVDEKHVDDNDDKDEKNQPKSRSFDWIFY